MQADDKLVKLAKNREQHSKLIAPFRSPLVKTIGSDDSPTVLESGVDRGATYFSTKIKHAPFKQSSLEQQLKSRPSSTEFKKKQALPSSTMAPVTTTVMPSHSQPIATARAAKPFKSPVSIADGGIYSPKNKRVSAVQLSPSIQALERRSQLLKRAIRIRREEEEEKLEALSIKWTQAAREVALELWALVRDSTYSGSGSNQNGAWGDEDQKEKMRSWGWDDNKSDEVARSMQTDRDPSADDDEDEENEQEESNLGTMLRQLGIDPATLGWNEEEEQFMD
jgi:hypothetical protein